MHSIEIYDKWELLLPEKLQGGYLIFMLYSRIQNKELSEEFTTEDIRLLLEDIKIQHGLTTNPHSERIIKNLLHFFIRATPGKYGKFQLTDYANRFMELMLYKLHNPYKNFPLKESFEKYFVICAGEVKSINELETKFGRGFADGQKQIITDHLEALQDELAEAYNQLNTILYSENTDATTIVRSFTEVFKKFSERAEDISHAVSSKDDFLRRLRARVDDFYLQAQSYKNPQSDEEKATLEQLQADWRKSVSISNDLEMFFKSVDTKIGNIRKQVLNASGKLTELQENFSSRSQFRLLVKKLFQVCLESASNKRGTILFARSFPLKGLVYEKVQLFYPEYFPFQKPNLNRIISVKKNKNYEREQKAKIELEIKRQEIIQQWVIKGKQRLETEQALNLNEWMNDIIESTSDTFIAQNVAIELSQFAAQHSEYHLHIKKELETLADQNMHTWKMKISRSTTIAS